MQRIISGGQRQGKTNFCVIKLKSYLQSTDRHIYTNLPIYPDIIAKQLTHCESRNPINFHEEMKIILARIHIIRKFPTWDELRDFRKKNPVYCSMHRQRDRELDFVLDESGNKTSEIAVNHERLFFPISCIYKFWEYKRYNSVIMIDEIYNYFSSLDYKKKGEDVQERRFQLLNYVLQHGHDKDDLYFITHDVSLIDINVQKGVQYTYVCYNSLNRNMIPADVIKKYPNILSGFRGLKHLYMYFIIEGFDRDNKTKDPDDYWQFRADKENFKCYNSFSKREGARHKIFLNKVSDSASAASSDINKSKFQILREFFVQAWPQFLIMFIFLSFIWFAYKAVYKLIYENTKVVAASPDKSKPVAAETVNNVSPGESSKVEKKLTRKVKITGITSNSLFYDDGFRIEKGGVYEGFNVIDIGRVFCTFGVNGKIYRVSTSGIRSEIPVEPKN